MGFKLADAYVEIGGHTGPLDRTLGSVKGKVAALAGMKVGNPLGGLGALFGGLAAGAGLSKAITGASDLAETMSKVQVTFGDASKTVTSFADEMAAKFGLVKGPLMDSVAGIGLIGKGAGLADPKAADLGTKMAKLAADASSFYNVPMDVALEKIRAGLVGESEPLRAFGVLLNEDAVKAEALRLGLSKGKKELDESSKVMARASLITRGLGTATGDLERTQGGFANQLRQLQGNIENATVSLGEKFLPAANQVITLFNEIATGGAGKLTEAFGRIGSMLGDFSFTFTDVIDTVRTVYLNWGDIVERTGVMIGGWFVNLGEYAVYFKDLAVDAFNAVIASASNMGKTLGSLITEVYDYITSGFKDPIQIKFEPLLEGFESKAKLKLSDVTDQLNAIDARMAKRAAERAAAENKATGAKASAANVNTATGAPGGFKSEFYAGGQDFSNAIQKAALGTQVKPTEAEKKQIDIATKQLTAAEKGTAALEDIAKGFKRMVPVTAAFA